MFFKLIVKFEAMTLKPNIFELNTHYDNKDYQHLKDAAHSIKGAAGYIGASRLYYQTYFMQYHYVNQNIEMMLQYYPGIIEAAIEFKIACRELLIAKGKKKPSIKKDLETIDHSSNFRLEKHPTTGVIYCCMIGQTL